MSHRFITCEKCGNVFSTYKANNSGSYNFKCNVCGNYNSSTINHYTSDTIQVNNNDYHCICKSCKFGGGCVYEMEEFVTIVKINGVILKCSQFK